MITGIVSPRSVALIGFLMFGNLIRECGVLDSLSETAQKILANLITLFLGITIATKMQAEYFLTKDTLMINRTRPCRIHFRYSRRCPLCEVFKPLFEKGQKDQPDDRCGGHLGVPDVRKSRSQNGLKRGQSEFPFDAFHRRQRVRADCLGHCRRNHNQSGFGTYIRRLGYEY